MMSKMNVGKEEDGSLQVFDIIAPHAASRLISRASLHWD
jgi:hypothetical protein